MLSSWTSGYQRYCTNSTPAYSPAAWSFWRGVVSVIVFATVSIDVILRISMLSVARPAAIHSPTWNFATLERLSVVAPASALWVICGSSAWNGRTVCSYDMPVITPSEACVSNCTWWMWMFDFEKPEKSFASCCKLVRVTATQSPMFARIASGWTGLRPASTSATSVRQDEDLAVGIDGAGARQLQPQAVERHDVEVADGGARRTDAVCAARPRRWRGAAMAGRRSLRATAHPSGRSARTAGACRRAYAATGTRCARFAGRTG